MVGFFAGSPGGGGPSLLGSTSTRFAAVPGNGGQTEFQVMGFPSLFYHLVAQLCVIFVTADHLLVLPSLCAELPWFDQTM